MDTFTSLTLALGAIALLVLLVTWVRVNAFLALLAASLMVGLCAGLPAAALLQSFQDGMGATLGKIAAIIALGAMLGTFLAESGAARELARRLGGWFGPRHAVWCVSVLALVVGLVTWFAVGLLLLAPVVIGMARESRRPLMHLAIPLLAFLSVMHGLMPPHPGPAVAAAELKASIGGVLGWGFVVGIPTACVAGPVFARLAAGWVKSDPPADVPPIAAPEAVDAARPVRSPGFAATLWMVLAPVALMLAAAGAELLLAPGDPLRQILTFLGHPVMALALAVLLAGFLLGRTCGFSRGQLLRFTESSVGSIGMTLLVVGGGGGFATVLREAGIARALGNLAGAWHLHPLLYGWMVAAFVRVATGSATVAITTAAGIMGPVLEANPHTNRELLVLSLGCGSLFLSHLNDGGFWIVKDSLRLTVAQTLRTWTIVESIVGIAGIAFILLLNCLL